MPATTANDHSARRAPLARRTLDQGEPTTGANRLVTGALVRSFDPRPASPAAPASIRETMANAHMLREDVGRFLTRWPAPIAVTSPTPRVDWAQCERQLVDLTVLAARKEMVPTLISAIRRDAAYKPGEMVLREILCLAGWAAEEG